jgi:carbamoyltransferase
MGAALYAHNSILKNKRTFGLKNIYLGSSYSDRRIKKALKKSSLNFKYFNDYDLIKKIAEYLYSNKVIGWFRGGMEWGPRALGNRSILANPTDKNARDNLNEKVKFREKFRPFAPVLCYDDIETFFENFEGNEKLIEYMLGVLKFKKEWRDKIPSVVHVNGTGRPQAIKREKNKLYYDLIKEFGKISGAPILINTSFNVRGEPIVRTPEEAIACFLKSGIDCLVLNNYLILKKQ